MKFQQTAKSQPGGGPRAQGIRVPDADTVAHRIGKDKLTGMVDDRHPGLRDVLLTLATLIGSGTAEAVIPGERLRAAALNKNQDIDEVPTEVTVTVASARGVSVLHKILALGVDAYLGEEETVCRHCREPVHHRTTYGGDDIVWFHRATGKIMCADNQNVAAKARRPRFLDTTESDT